MEYTAPIAFNNIAEAKREFAHTSQEIARMERDLRGCDWCCGGGDKEIARLILARDAAKQYLESHNESTFLAPICKVCSYADGTIEAKEGWHRGELLCARCIKTELQQD